MQQKLERSSSDSERPQDGHGHAEARTHTSMGAGGAAVGCRRAADGAEPRTAVELYRALTNYVMYTYGMDMEWTDADGRRRRETETADCLKAVQLHHCEFAIRECIRQFLLIFINEIIHVLCQTSSSLLVVK